ncbi:hypothetical protein EVAR_25561_1 [Eumeta japonica]|uniref:Uncharacterized protein n=1 Tax=Eumeta variegata TaxID=151549 RepID=A0A4C1Z4Z0_EUMVA|nr:hypothetical protein EVAR_25561_1 [Eumeta japonica]
MIFILKHEYNLLKCVSYPGFLHISIPKDCRYIPQHLIPVFIERRHALGRLWFNFVIDAVPPAVIFVTSIPPTWLQHENGPARPVKQRSLTEFRCRVIDFAVTFRPVSESSGSPRLPRSPTPHRHAILSIATFPFITPPPYHIPYSYSRGQ